MFKKLDKIIQDMVEVKGKLEDLQTNTNCDFRQILLLIGILKDSVEILDEDLKDHIETVKNFISDVR